MNGFVKFLQCVACCCLLPGCLAVGTGWSKDVVEGQGARIARSGSFADYDRLSVDVPVRIEIVRGTGWSYTITGFENQLALIEMKSSGGRLYVGSDRDDLHFPEDQPVLVELTVPRSLAEIELSSKALVEVHCAMEPSEMTVSLKDMASLSLDSLRVEVLRAELDDMSKLTVRGEAARFDGKVEDMSLAELGAAVVGDACCRVEDMGKCRLRVKGVLDGEVSDMGRMTYRGEPSEVKVRVSDMGSLTKDR
ncbi:DUF2807 domain-containing protein [uncultured Alistipes sp.]|uniref:GIN domain-containing protein n=1 Tax=uncultured Alistipes sp. TaxID=538949 RepID=UPI0026362362|nr:DUF2807 domain-containing protein [uncultured Alistipes sp.]